MKMQYYPDTDSLYIELSPRSSTESKEISTGVVADFDATGSIVGIDIEEASKKLDLNELELIEMPFQSKPKSA